MFLLKLVCIKNDRSLWQLQRQLIHEFTTMRETLPILELAATLLESILRDEELILSSSPKNGFEIDWPIHD